LSSSVTLRH